MRMRPLLFSALASVLLMSGSARAASTLHIGFGPSEPCATGCGGDPNISPVLSGSGQFDIYQQSNGAAAALEPVLMIIGVPNAQIVASSLGDTKATLFSNSSIASVTAMNPYPNGTLTSGTWQYGVSPSVASADYSSLIAPVGGGYYGDFSASSHGDVYSFLGLKGANNSNNWANWSGTENSHPYGYGPTQYFSIYVFSLNAPLAGNGMIDVTFLSHLTVPHGSFVIGYAETGTGKGSKVFDTPFTEAGMQAPEPSFFVVSGIGFLGLLLAANRKRLTNLFSK